MFITWEKGFFCFFLIKIRKLNYKTKKSNPDNFEDVIQMAKTISNQEQWCIILVNAGHFASAIFKG